MPSGAARRRKGTLENRILAHPPLVCWWTQWEELLLSDNITVFNPAPGPVLVSEDGQSVGGAERATVKPTPYITNLIKQGVLLDKTPTEQPPVEPPAEAPKPPTMSSKRRTKPPTKE